MKARISIFKYLLFLSTLLYCTYFGALMLDTFALVPLHKNASVDFLREYYDSSYMPNLVAFFAPLVISMIITSVLAWIVGWKMAGWKDLTVAVVTSILIFLMLIIIFIPINMAPIDSFTDEQLLEKFNLWKNANWLRLVFVFIGMLYSARALNAHYAPQKGNS